jgi:hypothetical protein
MVNFNQLKALGTDLIGKAGEIAEQAKEKAGPLAEQAKAKAGPLAEQAIAKAGPLAEQAKEKAGPLMEKAKEAAAKGVDIAAEKVDSATGHKYSDKIGSVSDRLGTHASSAPASVLDTPVGSTFPPETVTPFPDDAASATPIRDEIIAPYPPNLPPAPGSSV